MAEWNRQRAAGGKPSAMVLKKSFNAIKYQRYPWMTDIHRDAHAQPFANLSKAWSKFFSDIKSGIKAHAPRFKKKGQCKDGFYVANDKVRFDGQSVVLPLIGRVAMREALRFPGRVMGAAVSQRWPTWQSRAQIWRPRSARTWRVTTAFVLRTVSSTAFDSSYQIDSSADYTPIE
uniref:hypothetical protein n=1 Tax=Cupriavidus yeoncheonensis TaxID=1462994 RepID=UPI003F496D2A